MVGYPIVNVPLGTLSKNGLPFGLSFIGTVHFPYLLLSNARNIPNQH